jgi:hypothetical protein
LLPQNKNSPKKKKKTPVGLQQHYQKKLISSLFNENESHPYFAGQT